MKTHPRWIVRDCSIEGDPLDLLSRQASLGIPGKLIRGSRLRIELFMPSEHEPAEPAIAAIVHEWTQPPNFQATESVQMDHRAIQGRETLQRTLEQTGLQWTAMQNRVEWSHNTQTRSSLYAATFTAQWIQVQVAIGSVVAPTSEVREALIQYLLEMNTRLCATRVSLDGPRLTAEIVLPYWALSHASLMPLQTRLQEAAAVLSPALPWLRRPDVAARYLLFHTQLKGGEDHEHEPGCSRLESFAGCGGIQ